MEYADVLWHGCTDQLSSMLERVNLAAARVVTGATRHASGRLLYEETKWESLAQRREKHKLTFMYKIVNGLSPLYLSDRLPTNTPMTYNLRNENDTSVPRCRTMMRQNSFFPATIALWNSLDISIRNASSISQFKNKLNNSTIKVPSHFYCGSRRGQVLHARLRTLSSSLNDYLFRHNLIDSPRCTCGYVRETTRHYLLECNRYTRARAILVNQLPNHSNINISNLLYGEPSQTEKVNIILFRTVHDFIIQTKRF